MPSHHKIDTLIIIGNGFDIWQGLNTSYSQFETYYYEHLDEIQHVYVLPDVIGTTNAS